MHANLFKCWNSLEHAIMRHFVRVVTPYLKFLSKGNFSSMPRTNVILQVYYVNKLQ